MRSRRRRHRYELNADINVVSLIDVMLLLLVIYGLAALMVSGFPYFSPKNADLRKRFPIWILVFGIILIKVIVMTPQVMFFSLVLLYTLSGPLLWSWTTIQRRRGRRGELAEAQP
jgi:CDP-diacylglycerol--serine O-phosphatidyltransferase